MIPLRQLVKVWPCRRPRAQLLLISIVLQFSVRLFKRFRKLSYQKPNLAALTNTDSPPQSWVSRCPEEKLWPSGKPLPRALLPALLFLHPSTAGEPWVQASHGHGKEKAPGGFRLWWHAAPPLAARGAVLALQGHLALGFACHRWDPLFLSPPFLIAQFIPLHLGWF